MQGENNTERTPKNVNFDSITRNPKLMPRLRRDETRVALFVDLIQAGIDIEPIIINQNYELLDGDHRLAAYEKLSIKTIKVIVIHTANEHEAFRIATRLNSKHGLPYTNKDRQQQAIFLYTTWPGENKPVESDIIELAREIGSSRTAFFRYISPLLKPKGKIEDKTPYYDLGKSLKENAESMGISTSYAHKIKAKKISLSQVGVGNTQHNQPDPDEPVVKSMELDTAPQTRQQADATLSAVKEAAETPNTTLNESIQSFHELVHDAINDKVVDIESHGLSQEAFEEVLNAAQAMNDAILAAATEELLDKIQAYARVATGERRKELLAAVAQA